MKSKFLIAIGSLCLAASANASQLILNGGFETGDFTSWTSASSDGSGGGWYVTNQSSTPLNGFPTAGPYSGDYYAVTDGFGPGTNVLYQSFMDPIGASTVLLSFQAFVDDQFGQSGSGGEVDILAGNADPLAGTPLAVFYSADTAVVNGVPNPYVGFSSNIADLLTPGTTYILRLYESDSSGPINFGVDDVSLISSAATVPEPGTFPLLSSALMSAGVAAHRVRRRKARV